MNHCSFEALCALLGSFIGGKLSSKNKFNNLNDQNKTQQIFAIAVLIVLSAKLSKADAWLVKKSIVVEEKLNIPDAEIDNVAKILLKRKKIN